MTTHKNAKFETLKPFLSSFSHWHVKGFSSKRLALKVDVIGPENRLFAGASFSPEILQAGAAKGLTCINFDVHSCFEL